MENLMQLYLHQIVHDFVGWILNWIESPADFMDLDFHLFVDGSHKRIAKDGHCSDKATLAIVSAERAQELGSSSGRDILENDILTYGRSM